MSTSLTAKHLRELLHYCPESGVFTRLVSCGPRAKAGYVAGSRNGHGYIQIQIDKKIYQAHRLAWLYIHGDWPIFDIDHIDGDKSNNRLNNLRDVNRSMNMHNLKQAMKTNKSTGILGVSKHPCGKFTAKITVNCKLKHIGSFDNPNDAHEAYLNAKRIYHKGYIV